MSFKKWISVFLISVLIVSLSIGAFNILIDPFGIFGDKIFNWYSYNITNNPRTAKIGYLDKNYENYNSYIIGCSKTSSFSVDTLNKYNEGDSYYNLMMYGGDLYDIEKTAIYVIDNYNVENIIINIGLEEAKAFNTSFDKMKSVNHSKVSGESNILFYFKYIFANPKYSFDKISASMNKGYLPTQYDVFIADKGVYDKRKRDIESIVNKEEYINNNSGFLYTLPIEPMDTIDEAVNSIKRIKDYAKKNNVTFKLIASPVTDIEVNGFDKEQLKEYWRKLASVTEFWDFSMYSSISNEYRYFYDTYHFRNIVGDMALGKIYGDNSIYIPENFGVLVNKGNIEERLDNAFNLTTTNYTKKIPILMYHHIVKVKSDSNGAVISVNKFKTDMEILKENGYTPVFYENLVDYVYEGKELPNRAIIITFDDGYESNYELAYPILKELEMKATISIIGVSIGKDTYKDTGKDIFPHFDLKEAKEMFESGFIDIQNHSFDMHQVEIYDGIDYRYGTLKKDSENEKDYLEVVKKDYLKLKNIIEEEVNNDVFVFTYPYGFRDDITEALLRELDNKVTVTVDEGINEIVKGLPQSLYSMKRINVTENILSEELIKKIDNLMED